MNSSFDSDQGFSDLPYPGLRPFVREEADIFFGRSEQVYSLLNKLEKTRFLAVVGSSGCGKSSLIRAGLVPALEAGIMASAGSTWSIATMKPGSLPIQNLASALLDSTLIGEEWRRYPDATAAVSSILRRGSRGVIELLRELRTSEEHRYLIVVDQFEEIFRFHKYGNSNEAIAFVDLLLEAARQTERPIFVTLSMRSDFLGDCSLFNGLPEAINNGQFLVPRLTREQCREAVIGPAIAFGGMVEDTLVTRMLNDMQGDSDQLPLMQHALLQMWEMASAAQNGDDAELRLKLEHYEKIGGMDGSLSNHLEHVLQELAPAEIPLARKIFCRLTERSSSLRDTRRPAPLRELAEAADVSISQAEKVIHPFRLSGRSFLVPGLSVPLNADSIIDISHEALIRKWSRLSDWVDEESSAARIYQRLVETAELWEKNQAALWSTPDLENAIAWREAFVPNAAWASRYGGNFTLAMRFLDESQRAAEEHERLMLERQQRELELSQEVARAEKQRADDAEQSRARQAQANRRLRSLLFVAGTVSILAITALAWAIWSKLENTALKESQEKIAQANKLLEVANEKAVEARHRAESSFLELKKSREQLIQSNELAVLARAQEEEAKVQALLSKQAEERAQEEAKRLRITQGKANFQLANIRWNQGRVREAVELLESVPQEARSYEWGLCNRLFQGSYLTLPASDGSSVLDVAFSPDSKSLLEFHSNGVIKFYDVITGKEQRIIEFEGGVGYNSDMILSPDGKWIAVANASRYSVDIFDTQTEKLVAVCDLKNASPWNLEFSPDGAFLKVNGRFEAVNQNGDASDYYVLQIWSVPGWKLLKSFEKQVSYENHFSTDGKLVCLRTDIGSDVVNTITGESVCHLSSYGPPQFLPGKNDLVHYGFGTDGQGLYEILDGRSGEVKRSIRLAASDLPYSYSFVLSPDGGRILAEYQDNILRCWDVATGSLVQTLAGHTKRVLEFSFSPCGTKVATTSEDGTTRIWDMTIPLPLSHRDSTVLGKFLQAFDEGNELRTVWLRDKRNSFSVVTERFLQLNAEAGSIVNNWPVKDVGISAPTVTDDGRLLAFYSPNARCVKVQKVEDGSDIAEFPWPEEEVTALAISKDGALVSAVGGTRIDYEDFDHSISEKFKSLVITWDLNSRMERQRYENVVLGSGWEAERLNAIAFSPTQQQMLVSGTRVIKIFNLQEKGEERTIQRRRTSTSSGSERAFLQIDPRGELVIAGGEEEFAEVFDLKSGDLRYELSGEIHEVTACCFSPNGERIALGDRSGRLKICETSTGNELFQVKGYANSVTALFWPQDNQLLSQDSEGKLINWNSDFKSSNQKIASENVREIRRIPNSDLELYRGFDSFIYLIDRNSREVKRKIALPSDDSLQLTLAPQGDFIVAAGRDGVIRMLSLSSGETIHEIRGHVGEVTSLRLASGGSRLISWGADKTVRLWNLTSGEQLGLLTEHWTDKSLLILDASEDDIALFDQSSMVRVFETVTGNTRYQWDWAGAECELHFIEETDQLVASSNSLTRIWDTRNGKLLVDSSLSYWGGGVQISKDGRYEAKISAEGLVEVCDTESRATVLSLTWKAAQPSVVFSSRSNFIFLTNGSAIEVWDINSREKIIGAELSNIGFVFSPDDKFLVVTERGSNSLHVWDLGKRNKVVLDGSSGRNEGRVFSTDMKKLYSFGADGVSAWDLSTSNLDWKLKTPHVVRKVVVEDSNTAILCCMDKDLVALIDGNTGKAVGVASIAGWVSRAKIMVDKQSVEVTSYPERGDSEVRTLRFEDFRKVAGLESGVLDQQAKNHFEAAWIMQLTDASQLFFDNQGRLEDRSSKLIITEDYPSSTPSFRLWQTPVESEIAEQSIRLQFENAEKQWHRQELLKMRQIGSDWAAMFHSAWLLKADPALAKVFDQLHELYKNWATANPPNVRNETGEETSVPPGEIRGDGRLPLVVQEMLRVPRGEKTTEEDAEDDSTANSKRNLAINDRIWRKVARPLAAGVSISPEELEEMRQVVEEEPTGAYVNTLAVAEYRAGNLDKAIDAFQKSIVLNTDKSSEDQVSYSSDYAVLVMIYLKQGNQQEAEKNFALFEKAIANEKARNGRNRLSADVYSFAVEMKTAYLGKEHLDTVLARRGFGLYLSLESDHEAAKIVLDEVIALLEKALGRSHVDTQLALAYLGFCYKNMKKYDEAYPLLEEAYRFGKENKDFGWVESNLRFAYVDAQKLAAYDRWMMEERLPDVRKALAADSAALAGVLYEYGSEYYSLNGNEQAEKVLLEAMEKARLSESARAVEAKIGTELGKVYLSAKRYPEAKAVLEHAHIRLLELEIVNPKEEPLLMINNLIQLIRLYTDQMDAAKAAEYEQFKKVYEAKRNNG